MNQIYWNELQEELEKGLKADDHSKVKRIISSALDGVIATDPLAVPNVCFWANKLSINFHGLNGVINTICDERIAQISQHFEMSQTRFQETSARIDKRAKWIEKLGLILAIQRLRTNENNCLNLSAEEKHKKLEMDISQIQQTQEQLKSRCAALRGSL